MEQGKKKVLWFNDSQLELLEMIKEITNESNSLIVRKSMSLYYDTIKNKKK